MVTSYPIEYAYSNDGRHVTSETLTWERPSETDLTMSTAYSYDSSNRLQEYVDYNGNSTYYKYNSRTGELSGKGHTIDNNVITDVKSLQKDASSLLKNVEQIIKNVETNSNVTLGVEYYNASGRVEEVKHNGYSHIFEYNDDGTLAVTYTDNDNLLSYNCDEYRVDYTYSNGELSVVDYSNGYRVKYLTGTDNQGNTTKTIGCYNVIGENETLIKSYVYTFDEDGILSSIYDNRSGLTITYTDSDLLSYEISDYELLYKRTVNSDGTVSEQYRQRNYTNNQNTSFDTLETSETVVSYNSDGTRTMTSSVSAEKNTSYYNYGTYYHGTFDYEKESVRDYFDRISSKSVEMIYQRDNTPGNITSQVEYDYTDLGNGRTSGLVSDYSQSFCKQNNNNTISTCQTYNRKYEYDNKGNIQFVYEVSGNTTVPKQYYEYDNADQIITEINFENQISAHYTYNAGGNLTAKIYYDFSTLSFNVTNRQIVSLGQEIRRVSYQYDSVWKDRVIYYSDTGFTDDNEDDSVYQAITYDKMGNPLKYVGDKTLDLAHFAIQSRSPDRIIIGDLEWNGNRLVSFEISDKRYEYNYDANGFRTSKITYNKTTNSGNTTYEKSNIIDYYWDNGVLTGISSSSVNSQGQRINTQTAMIIYDQEGTPTGYLSLAGVPYLFKKDLNENVLSLVYTDGTDICSVRYDAWGSPQLTLYGNIIQQAVAMVTVLLCPVSYHGYLYDYESGLYFNQGRSYSPSWGRYISPESPEKLTNRSEDPLDSNLYLFSNNNTVNKLDIVASWSRIYNGLEWKANGFEVVMSDIFASRSICVLFASQIIKAYGTWDMDYGYNYMGMSVEDIASDLFAHYVGKNAKAAINKVNACWGDGWILKNSQSDKIFVCCEDPNLNDLDRIGKYYKIWIAAPEIKAYAQKEGVFITL
jgi:RHS repeat-associated protein